LEKGVTLYGEVKPKEGPEDLFEAPKLGAFDTTFSYDTHVNQIDLLSEETLEGAGVLVRNVDEQVMVGEQHQVYFTMRKNANVQLGDVFTVFRVQKQVEHPVKRTKVGHLVNLLGEVQTVDAQTLPNGKIVYTGRVIDATSEITIGDRLMPMNREALRIRLKMTDLELTGTIIQSTTDNEFMLAANRIAFIDLGLKQGLKVGNSFSIWRASSDPANLPNYKIGNLIVIRVGDKTSTVVVTNSTRPVQVGDTVITDVQ
jgi:hypothetical protein